ncbi:MAG: restriction endonuclease subunit S [Bacteroidetes bacterium]|nr:restriction endonuclease subunit S [Bacteroidota bacterium]
MKLGYRKLGDFIQQVNNRNSDLSVTNLIGVTLDKCFIPSVANTVGADMSKYKVINKGQFACKLMSVGRDKKLPVSYYTEDFPSIVSSAYFVFEIIDNNELLDDYLMMWFRRPETDRYLGFISGGDVRGSISWDDLCTIEIKVPDKQTQQEIVNEYNTVTNRIKLNEQLNQKLEQTAQALYKHWFVDFEFPNKEGKPYKSSGGEMIYNEELDKEIPKWWNIKKISEVSSLKAGGDKPKKFSEQETKDLNIPIYSNSSQNEGLYGYTDKPNVTEKSITISARGAIIGYTVLREEPFVPIVRLIVVTPNNPSELYYLYESIREFKFDNSSSAQGQLTVPDISSYEILKPSENVIESYFNVTSKIHRSIKMNKTEANLLEEISQIILAKMSNVESEIKKEAIENY